ncbi:P-loop containing nucleoside triphosphate hydrolase protein [Fimicolochytrium jonesii]|uniref:P-loop containing nucleoside triphosphate hydrolase protein n=1 Tax=Fimicolochytrium jonesii TaxID=1396493 RepID=UPI0022FF01C4|nr:P-loop containing nucleoside triphosphate hydrolase protein [Fimicolochytrium jonesii]KAI8820291.1 P-loop containing nucleoside triphosphate hydrolase protein [Fimicolochytrium jonesii]
MRRFALNVKTALINAVFEKTLSVDSLSFQRFSKGYVVNLVTVDCEGITGGLQSMHDLWAIPAQIVTVLAIMGHILGISVWAGAGGLIGAVFVVMFIAPALMARAAPQMSRFDDERIRLIKETVQGIKLVKAQVWEQIFASKIIAARANQAKSLFVFNIGIVCFVVVGQLGTTIAPVCAFSLYAAKGHMMKAAIVFPSIAFFSILVDPLIALPQTLSGIMSASQSWKRVYQFLTAKRQVPVTERSSHSAPAAETKLSSETAILIEKASFSWAPKEYHTSVDVGANATSAVLDSAFLKDINVNIPKGSLTAIVGVVGSGKTSLLSAITGHMQCVEGYAYVGGTFAYTSQQPWVQSTTVKDNITFGLPYDERKLQNVIRATAMQRDVDSFEDGIHSAIAEKGSNLSGGQKSRLACARAMYNDADIYVMDDPLAALDATVAREVFENCIRQGLASKTRILVTHHLDLLQAVDSIIVMSEGRVLEQGSFTELSKAGTHLSALLAGKARASEEQDDASEATTAEDPKVPSHIAATSASNTAIELSAETLPATIIAEEMSDSVSWSTYRSYIDAAGGGLILVSLLVQILLYQAGNVIMTQWLSWWTSDKFMQGTDWWIGRYNAVAWTAAFLLIIMNTNILRGVSRASNTFHQRAVEGVLRAPLSWFESQSVGRIVNRFSRDVAALDQAMMPIFFQLVAGLGTFLSIAVTVTYNVPIMSAVLGVMVIAYYLVFRYYHRTARELRRLEATERSPLYSYINETMEGIPTISAFRREDDFRHRAKQLIDQSNRASFLRYNAELWVTLRMDLISAVVIAVLAGLGETSFAGTASNFGMALAYSAALTYIMTIIVRSIANLESEIYSVLRLQEYADRLPSEAQGADIRVDPSKAWPSQGHIRVKGFSAHYASRPDRLCLQDVDLEILPGQRICMVGRTGSGKSTLLLALLRMIERDAGSITVDDREIHSMALEDLRHGLNLIVQDAYLFSGTIRTTLDIRQNLTDEQLWSALEAVDMKPYVSSLPQKLDTPVTGNGESISAGQRQLLCLARAVLDNPRILLLDEATGSVDAKTEQTIHKIIRERCPHATVLSVMHRLQEPVIAGFDKVLVMSDGSVAEFERPEVLLGRPDSLFSQLMKASSGKD